MVLCGKFSSDCNFAFHCPGMIFFCFKTIFAHCDRSVCMYSYIFSITKWGQYMVFYHFCFPEIFRSNISLLALIPSPCLPIFCF